MGYYYSLDLRRKAVEARKGGATVSSIMKMFGIARQTVYSWLERDRANKLPAKIPDRTNTRKVDYERLAEYVRENNDKYLYEIGQHFNLSAVAVFKILKKLKITLKKKSPVQKKR